jgi:predicted transcriptional regulator
MNEGLKLFDSELKVMEKLWAQGEMKARDLAKELEEEVGWKKTTTYTVIKKCIGKGAIERIEPNFICKPLIMREQIQQYETEELIERYYDGAINELIASLLSKKVLSSEEIRELKKVINNLEGSEKNDI